MIADAAADINDTQAAATMTTSEHACEESLATAAGLYAAGLAVLSSP
jgi:hypothetical protein